MSVAAQEVHAATERGHRRLRFSPSLASAAIALALIGLVMVASASISVADAQSGQPLWLFWRQSAYLCVAIALTVGVAMTPTHIVRRSGPMLLLAATVALAVVLVPGLGREVNGSTRWLTFGPVNVQPSEFVKIFTVIYLAGYLIRRRQSVRSELKGFINPLLLTSIISLLLLAEPDYGATVVLFATTLAMLFLAGVPFVSFATWVLAIVSVFALVMVIEPYRMERLMTFLNPWGDPFGSGFQLTQALIAIGRGEWLGVGLGQSVQKLHYLPEAHTDFLFAVLAEELGLIGVLLVLALFTFVVWRAFRAGQRAGAAGDGFASHLAYGLGVLFALQAYVNIGVNLGLLPTKGLTLPLMSYGGSSLLANGMLIGLLLRIDAEHAPRQRNAT